MSKHAEKKSVAAIPTTEWKWLGHTQHHVLADRCQFRLSTQVGEHVISTLGGLVMTPGDKTFSDIGSGRLYETYVFRATGADKYCGCPTIDPVEVSGIGSETPQEATARHMAACHWAAHPERLEEQEG